MKILFFGAEKLPAASKSLAKKTALKALGKNAKLNGELSVIFVDAKKIHALNKKHLGHDCPTDVIAFPYYIVPGIPAVQPFGDVYVSLDAAKAQAKALGHDFLTELLTLVAHGTLHLSGYDDKTAALKKAMFKKQDAVVRSLRKPRPYGAK